MSESHFPTLKERRSTRDIRWKIGTQKLGWFWVWAPSKQEAIDHILMWFYTAEEQDKGEQ